MADEADIEPLLDILELIERIERQTSRMDKLGFLGDPDAQVPSEDVRGPGMTRFGRDGFLTVHGVSL